MSVSSRRQTPTWPFLLVLVSLFALSLTAPRRWERIARSKPLVISAKHTLQPRRPRLAQPPAVGGRAAASEPTLAPPETSVASEPGQPAPAAPRASAPPRGPLPDLGPAIGKLATPSLLGPEGQLAVRIHADLAPRVALRPEKPAPLAETAEPVLKLPLPPVEPPTATLESAPTEATRLKDESPAPANLRLLVEPSVAPTLVADDESHDPGLPGFTWTEPVQLLERLEGLTDRDGARPWAYEVIALIHELLITAGPNTPEAGQVLDSLQRAAQASSEVAAEIAGPDSTELQRVAYALKRRMAAWEPLRHLPPRSEAELAVAVPEPDRLALCLSEIDAATQANPAGSGWRDYLLFDSLQGLAAGTGGSDAQATRQLAQRVLARLAATRLSRSQRRFVADETLSRLAGELRCWAAAPVDGEQLLAHLESYEQSPSSETARLLALDLRQLAWSPAVELQEFGRELEQNYRNANVRVVLSEEMLSRMMPLQDPVDESVRVTILGAPTRGRSRTETDLTARLIPDPHRLRFLVEATGRVSARTNSHSGPATMHSSSNSTFSATREMEMTLEGLRAKEMEVSAHSRARLRDVNTSFDSIPVVGAMVSNYARQKYLDQRAIAERELERIVAQKAIDNIAAQSTERVATTNAKLAQHVLEPMARLQIEPTLIESATSDERMTVRMRIAGDEQLGAHTPRPRAPGHSLLSAQIHESAINNFLDRLKLGGKLQSERELYHSLSGMLGLPPEFVPPDLHDNVLLQLSEVDPIRVRFADGRIAIELRVDELRAEGQTFRDFVVRAYYAADPNSRQGQLMRDGTVQLIGRGLRAKGQVALRGMFSKTFSKERRLAIVPEKLLQDPRMAGIEVVQWTVADGWIGIALADVRPGHSPVARAAPKTTAAAKAPGRK
ncbi:MAG: hypothetical protein JNG90_08405 [Planctomycetaceae bacterium]|nr:hypothetical protein [Planctomycetaceae bacterium]